MRFRWACITLCACQSWGCENPRPVLTNVAPAQAYSDADVRLTLTGDGFLPATTVGPRTGNRVAVVDGFHVRMIKGASGVELTDLAWQSTNQMEASLPGALAAALPGGPVDVELTDPRGQRTTLTNAFVELGPDNTPPVVAFTSPSPDAPVAPGMTLRGNIHASDAPLGIVTELYWTYSESGQQRMSGRCPIPTHAPEVDCPFQVKVNTTLQGGETIQFVATARDAANAANVGRATLSFTVLPRPTVASIWPISGGTAGGTDIVITGSGFRDGSQAILDDVPLFPEGGIVVNEHTLSGHVPAHAEGSTAIVVHTPLGDATGVLVFTYLPPPQVETITPNTGSATGATVVVLTGKNFTADTRIYFGRTLDSAIPLDQPFVQSDTTILGRTPGGSGQTTVWAWSEALGFTRLQNGFTWRTP
jgi:hypothetical protein